jgi:hypothetical protein
MQSTDPRKYCTNDNGTFMFSCFLSLFFFFFNFHVLCSKQKYPLSGDYKMLKATKPSQMHVLVLVDLDWAD